MTKAPSSGCILVAPHQFPHLDRERALAEEFGLGLIAAADQASFSSAMADARIVMVTPYAKVTADDIASLDNCQAVVRYGMGYDNIDVSAAAASGVPVSIVPDASTDEVATHAFAMGLALSRRLPQGHAAIRDGGWAGRIAYDAPKLTDLVVGVVGLGRIGRIVAASWSAVGARVHAYDPFTSVPEIPAAELTEVLEKSHVVSLHLPLTDETRHLVSGDVLRRMRPGAVVVNVSRGGLVDEQALADALHSGHLAGAALDVFAQEPLPTEHPLREAPNVILTPHIAWRSTTSLGALQDGAVSRARRALAGEPLIDLV
ncbi:C-terminal binding protein [Streptomyces caeruleatus]|uniref:Hydroxyacid dehydrogenase n=1 Tax=Streptomyces caeruleatus TaxID=661399 RepID=A0A101U8F5_9ACTN|nr:C-terminal binding protein [Streptomyces caeruleatus]KUO06145.1 hydroxyacid dehydrogenase [Streptomyces caeruleatus]